MFRLYMGNISWSATDTELRELLASFGTITRLHMVREFETGRFRGFAFVTFDRADSAQAAQRALDGQLFQNRVLRVSMAQERPAVMLFNAAEQRAAERYPSEEKQQAPMEVMWQPVERPIRRTRRHRTQYERCY